MFEFFFRGKLLENGTARHGRCARTASRVSLIDGRLYGGSLLAAWWQPGRSVRPFGPQVRATWPRINALTQGVPLADRAIRPAADDTRRAKLSVI